jgi:hypothetical protein
MPIPRIRAVFELFWQQRIFRRNGDVEGGFDGIEAEAFDHATEALVGVGIFLIEGDELVDHGEGLFGGEVFEEFVGDTGAEAPADAAGEEGPALGGTVEADVFEVGFGTLEGASGGADFSFTREGHAVEFFVEDFAQCEGVLLAAFTEGGTGAGFDGADADTGDVAVFESEFSPDGVNVLLADAEEGGVVLTTLDLASGSPDSPKPRDYPRLRTCSNARPGPRRGRCSRGVWTWENCRFFLAPSRCRSRPAHPPGGRAMGHGRAFPQLYSRLLLILSPLRIPCPFREVGGTHTEFFNASIERDLGCNMRRRGFPGGVGDSETCEKSGRYYLVQQSPIDRRHHQYPPLTRRKISIRPAGAETTTTVPGTKRAVAVSFSQEVGISRIPPGQFARPPIETGSARRRDHATWCGFCGVPSGSMVGHDYSSWTTAHGTQFRRRFHAALACVKVQHVRGRVRVPFLSGKMEGAFRMLRVWWRMVLAALAKRNLQRRVDDYRLWYNAFRPHSAVGGLTPGEAVRGMTLPASMPVRAREAAKAWVEVRRRRCRGDPRLPVIQITRRAA